VGSSIDTHHHLFETALSGFLANGLLLGRTPGGDINYFQYILLTFGPVYGPQDVYINELFGSLPGWREGLADRTPARSSGRGAHRFCVRDAPDLRCARAGTGWR
jgi:hypothetical protein